MLSNGLYRFKDHVPINRSLRPNVFFLLMEDFFDKVLHYYGRKGQKLFMINIGAMDGVMFDSMSGYAQIYNSDVLYVEPMKPHF